MEKLNEKHWNFIDKTITQNKIENWIIARNLKRIKQGVWLQS